MLLFLSSLLDNWIELEGFGLKVFDLLFIFLVCFKIFYTRTKLHLTKNDLNLSYIIIFYFSLSLLYNPLQIVRNIYIVFVFLLSFVFGRNINPKIVLKILRINLLIWIFGFYLQFFYFQISGQLLNLTFFTTQYLRVNIFNTLLGVRYTSFAIEPNSFVTIVSILLVAYLTYGYDNKNFKFRRFNFFDVFLTILTIYSTYISGSFFSYITIASFIVIFIPSFIKVIAQYKNIKISSLIILSLLISLSLYNFEKIKEKFVSRITTESLIALEVDDLSLNKNRSFYDRTARLLSNECLANIKSPNILIGTGLDTVNYHPKCGVNTVSYLLLNFGILGNLILYFSLYKRVNLPFRIWILLTSPFLYPLIGSVFFPLVLGMLIEEKNFKNLD